MIILYVIAGVFCAFLCEWYLSNVKTLFKHWNTYLTAIAFVILFVLFSKTISAGIGIIKAVLLTNCLYIASVTDIRTKEIPNKIVLLLFILGVLLVVPSFNPAVYLDAFGGALIAAGLLYVANVFSKGDVGMGDVKLFGAAGIYLGFFGTLNAMLLSMLLGASYGVMTMIFKRKNLKSSIPFAPFIAIGAIAAMIGMQ